MSEPTAEAPASAEGVGTAAASETAAAIASTEISVRELLEAFHSEVSSPALRAPGRSARPARE